jgi:hypothetical protein
MSNSVAEEDLRIGISALFSALVMALDDEEHRLAARMRDKLDTLHKSMRGREAPPRGAMEMLALTDDILHVWSGKER